MGHELVDVVVGHLVELELGHFVELELGHLVELEVHFVKLELDGQHFLRLHEVLEDESEDEEHFFLHVELQELVELVELEELEEQLESEDREQHFSLMVFPILFAFLTTQRRPVSSS